MEKLPLDVDGTTVDVKNSIFIGASFIGLSSGAMNVSSQKKLSLKLLFALRTSTMNTLTVTELFIGARWNEFFTVPAAASERKCS